MSKLLITKDYYINFLIKIYRERSYHNDFSELNEKKLKIINKYLGLNDYVQFDFKKKIFVFKADSINLSRLKFIKNYNHFNEFKENHNKDNLISYINTYLNLLFDKITKSDYNISLGIELCTNDMNEFVKNIINCHNRNAIINSHFEQINKQYREALENLFNVLYTKDFLNSNESIEINWNIEVTNEKDLNLLNESLDEYDYF